MLYNVYIQRKLGTYNLLGLEENKIEKIANAYLNGETEFTLSGQKYHLANLYTFQIFTHEHKLTPDEFKDFAIKNGLATKGFFGGHYLEPNILGKIGKNVTENFIGDSSFGEKVKKEVLTNSQKFIVNPQRIEELKKCTKSPYDFTRLIKFCEEMNDNFERGNYLSVAMIGRSILNHIPPILGLTTFNEVESNYGGSSFKKVMSHLNKTMRSIADSFLHDTIRKKENIPNDTQVNFAQDLDYLLAEIVRVSS